jgi:fructose-bisphosphate aldolase class II
MPLVTSTEILRNAFRQGYAVGAFNANNLEYVQGIIEAATEEKAPVILQVSQGAIKYAGLTMAAEMVKVAAQEAPVPVVLHLDHGTDFEQNVRCLRAGFTSLMYDGSLEPLEKNIAVTRKLTEIAHAVGIPVESELGRVAGTEDGYEETKIEGLMTDPRQAREFVERTHCDSLAVAVGSVHRMQTKAAPLDIARIRVIRNEVDIPLVLHGGSGVSVESLSEAMKAGIAKINVATQLNMAFVRGMADFTRAHPEEADPRKPLGEARKALKEIVRSHIRLFGCAGKA